MVPILFTWLAVAIVDLITLVPGGNPLNAGDVTWLWQIVLIIPGALLALQPLLQTMRATAGLNSPAVHNPFRLDSTLADAARPG